MDKRRLLELEEQKRRAEEDKLQAITELEVRGLEADRVDEPVLRKTTGLTKLLCGRRRG